MRIITLHSLRKLASLSRGEWSDLIRAQIALLSAQVLVWTRPVGKLIADAPGSPAPDSAAQTAPSPRSGSLERASQLALAVGRVAENGPLHPLCLVRAVALNHLLEASGIHGSRIRIGVRMERGRFAAHAWVEYGGVVLGDLPEHVHSFAQLTDITLADAP
jgi:hypothetical protein